jgi:GNAT superfamily N-acetyltransferase
LDEPVSHDHPHAAGPTADASVRTAHAGDAEAIGDVQAAVWREAYADVLPEEALSAFRPEDFARVWRASLENPPSPAYRLLVALTGPQVVGFAAVGPSADPDGTDADAEILVGGVESQFRRQGHGSRLLNAAVDTLREGQFATAHTWLLAGDTPTLAFLVGAGFAPDGARRNRVVGPTDREVAAEIRLTAYVSA